MIRKGLALLSALLVAFHLWLFGRQLWEGQLVGFPLAARWLLAAGLVAALMQLRRRGLSMVWGRHTVALWVLAALLHGPAVARNLSIAAPAVPEVIATLAQSIINIGGIGIMLLLGLAGLRRRARQPLRRLAVAPAAVDRRAIQPGSFLDLAPRPPPVA